MNIITKLQKFYAIERRMPGEAWSLGIHCYKANGYTEIALAVVRWTLLVTIPR